MLAIWVSGKVSYSYSLISRATVRNGVVSQSKLLDLLSLDGSNSILGRAVVVHNLTDTCTGSVGNAGSRLGFGTIGSRFSTGTNVAKSTAANITRLVSVMGPTTVIR